MEHTPEKDLWNAVIITALNDMKDKKYREEVIFFFKSRWFEEISEKIDIDVEAFRKVLKI